MIHKSKIFRCSSMVMVLFALLATGCSSPRPVEPVVTSQAESRLESSFASSSSLESSSSLPLESSSENSSDLFLKVENILPEQVVYYMKESLKGSKLLTISPGGKVVKAISYPGQCLSNAQLSPNGRYMLCQTDAEGGGEGYFCGYTIIDLQTGKQYPYSERQAGHQSHIILSDNLIGYASGSPIGGVEPWKSIKLFDMQYHPLDITLDFDSGNEITQSSGTVYNENRITGIGYNPKTEIYYLTFARDTSYIGLTPGMVSDPFSETRLGIAVFDKTGKLIEKRILPKEYMAPYSHNTLSLWNTNPVVLPDGWLVVRSMIKEDDCPLLLVNSSDWTLKRLSYSGSGSDTNVTGMIQATLRETSTAENTYKVLMDINVGDITAALKLPETIQEAGYANKFTPTGAEWKNGKGYLTAYNVVDNNEDICGLFSWDGSKTKLIHLLPAYFFNTLGIDKDGNCLVLLYGTTPQMIESYYVY